ncbi:Deoxynucleotidyltransferase terminal-interacting protein 2 [Bulinus truncatus]|nr:Deoxynucleotidyltransferase terminal-interacting protein 2 [Bulinus truncatus]
MTIVDLQLLKHFQSMEETDLSDDSSSCEDTSSSDESCSSEETNISTDDVKTKHKDFKMSVLHSSSNDVEVTYMFREFLKDNVKSNKGKVHSSIRIGGYEKDFTPWWENLTKGKVNNNKINQSQKKDDSFDNWFSTNAVGKSDWLCGPCPMKESISKPQVQDIPVPSIYDRKPTTKGRRALKKERKAERQMTTGSKWFGMKAPDLDDKLKNDMELIRMRGVLDPKRFYKHHDRKGLPKYFQMGTVMDEGTDFYSSRLTQKQRKQNLVDELMADADIRQYNKRKYAELQQKMRFKQKAKGQKGHKKIKK